MQQIGINNCIIRDYMRLQEIISLIILISLIRYYKSYPDAAHPFKG